MDGSGNVYVADWGNHRIQRWGPGATIGSTVAGGNGPGGNANQLNRPHGVYVDGSGNVYVADPQNHRIQRWASGATSGSTVASGNAYESYAPHGVYVDGSGNVYVDDGANHRIQRWPPGATIGTTVAGGNGVGGNANQLNYPYGVYLDGSCNMYVVDRHNHRIQRFTPAIRDSLPNAVAGTYTVTVTDSTGCSVSSAPVTVIATTSSTQNRTICSHELPYTWDGLTFAAAGTQIKTGLTNAGGCDSTAIYNLTVIATTSSTQNRTICSHELPYTWDGLTFAAAGTQIKTGLTNAGGCDSTAIYNLTVNAIIASYQSRTICSNELPYTWDGLTFTAAGTQTKTGLTNAGGCDSTATYNLTVNASPATPIISGTLCAGSTLTVSPTNGLYSLVWNLNGTPVSTVSNTWNTIGSTVAGGNGPGGNANQLNDPFGVYVDGSGNIYVSDWYNHRIQRWAPGATTGTTVAGGNGQGGNANQLNYPLGVYVDGSGNVYVVDIIITASSAGPPVLPAAPRLRVAMD